MEDLFLCSDMDRTVIPNGAAAESAAARPLLRRLAALPEVCLAYVTGRNLAMIEEAIEAFQLPMPDHVAGDVGTTVYSRSGDEWVRDRAWDEEISADWGCTGHADLAACLADVPGLRLQEPTRQSRFKLSYYTPCDWDAVSRSPALQHRLMEAGADARLIWSVDEAAGCGLLDVIPARATKLHAVEFLMRLTGSDPQTTVFAGDSGNDLPALTSGLQAVLVANAPDDVRQQAIAELAARGHAECLYEACGTLPGLNGNYAAGVLEGVAHFRPDVAAWLDTAQKAE